jgi:hypothetical protein
MSPAQKAAIDRICASHKPRTILAPESKPENRHNKPRGRYAPVTSQMDDEMRRLDSLNVKRTKIAQQMNIHPTTIYKRLGRKRKLKLADTVRKLSKGLR